MKYQSYLVFLCNWQFSIALAPQNHKGLSRRSVLEIAGFASITSLSTPPSMAEDVVSEVEVAVSGDAKTIFNQGRALESQGNMAAAQRLYAKVTKISPRVCAKTIVSLTTCNMTHVNFSLKIYLIFALVVIFVVHLWLV
jgi:hypothetical protein